MRRPKPARQRLFFALRPPPDCAQSLTALARQLPAPAAIHPVAQLHLTLAFLGHLNRAQRSRAEAAAAQVHASAFVIRLNRLGCFERSASVWAGCNNPPPALLQLMQCLRSELSAHGIAMDNPVPVPHVTLARKLRQVPEIAPPDLRWQVREFHLFVSQPGNSGPQYQCLGTWPLLSPAD